MPERRSRRSLVGAALTLLLLAGADGDAARDVLEAVERHYEGVTDLQAAFVQDSLVASLGKEERTRGTVTVLRPGRMRWEYTAPERRVIVMDGKTLRIYSPEDRQLQIASLTPDAISPTALQFLLGGARLQTLFEAKPAHESRPDALGLELTPRSEAGFASLEIWVDPETYALRESLVVDLFGNRTRIRFQALRENTGVAEEKFTISVPKDTEVIDLR
ncbi:MAG: outer membrane lipoprotein carrier protein LolA [Myxococcota bacterium]